MKTRLAAVGIAASGALILAGCGAANETAPAGGSGSTGGAPAVSGTISGAGASTQQAATQAWVAGFQKTNPEPRSTTTPAVGRRAHPGSSPARSPPGTTRPSPPTTPASTCPHRHHARAPPRQVRHHAELHRLPARRGRPTGPPVADEWPIQGGEAAQGTSGVVGAVKGGKGTIGYADESQAKGLGDRQGQGRRRVRRAARRGRRQGRSKPRSAVSGTAATRPSPTRSTARPPRPAPTRSSLV